MIDRAQWPAIETLLHLVVDGKVRRSAARQPEIDALQSLGWVTAKGSQLAPETGRTGDLSKRLTSFWPDWEAQVEAAKSNDLALFDPASYAPGRRTIEVALGVDPDPISIEIIKEILAGISGDRAALDLRIRNLSGRTIIVDIVDTAEQSAAAFEREVADLRSRLVSAFARLREKEAMIGRLQKQVRDIAADIFIDRTAYHEMHAALVAVEILGFGQMTATEKGDAVSLFSRMLDHSLGQDAIAWRGEKGRTSLLVVKDPLAAITAVFRLARHLAIEQVGVRCALSYGLISFEPVALSGRKEAGGVAVDEVITLQETPMREAVYEVVSTGDFRNMLFDGSDRFSFARLPPRSGEPLSGTFGVMDRRN